MNFVIQKGICFNHQLETTIFDKKNCLKTPQVHCTLNSTKNWLNHIQCYTEICSKPQINRKLICWLDFIGYLVVVGPIRRQSQTGVSVDGRRGHDAAPTHSWWQTFSAVASTCRWSRDAEDFCALSMNFWCDIVDGKTRRHTVCPTVRVCLESDAWVNSNRRMFVDSTDILVVHLYRH